jgi:5-methylcytosine-specific restriction endonuclease McrA
MSVNWKKNKEKKSFQRKGIVTLEEVLPHIKMAERKSEERKTRINLLGESVKISSLRLLTFKESQKCYKCGLEGKFFAIEKTHCQDVYHINFYGYTKEGKEVMLTKDHIIPRSKGGRNHLDNLKTMCSPCNVEKGNKL